MGVFANSINGIEGQVTVPTAGALIGYFSNWSLRSEDGDLYSFRGNLAYLNEAAWNEVDLPKQVAVDIGKGKSYILDGSSETSVSKNVLTMKGVKLCPAS